MLTEVCFTTKEQLSAHHRFSRPQAAPGVFEICYFFNDVFNGPGLGLFDNFRAQINDEFMSCQNFMWKDTIAWACFKVQKVYQWKIV